MHHTSTVLCVNKTPENQYWRVQRNKVCVHIIQISLFDKGDDRGLAHSDITCYVDNILCHR